jgi:hypothetical protein
MRPPFCYYLASQQPLKEAMLKPWLEEVIGKKIQFQFISPHQRWFLLPTDECDMIQSFLSAYTQEYHDKIHVLITYRSHRLGEVASLIGVKQNQGKVDHLADVLIQLMVANNPVLIPLIRDEFKSVPRHLMLTAIKLMQCGMNASLASQKLYLHRNTFTYRLNQFINLTGLDIRDHNHALFFNLAQRLMMQPD